LNYGRILVINNFIADSREATLNYYAKDIINERDNLEKMMRDSLQSAVGPYGIVVDELLVKDIDLPSEVDAVIQDQVRAQQDVKSTELGIEKQRKEQVFTLEKDSMQEAANIQKQRMDEKFAIEKDSMQTAADIQEQRTQEQFAIEKQKDEAKRTLIEANAKKEAMQLEASALTDKVIQYESVQISKGLVTSPNTKLIITNGSTPVRVNTSTGGEQ